MPILKSRDKAIEYFIKLREQDTDTKFSGLSRFEPLEKVKVVRQPHPDSKAKECARNATVCEKSDKIVTGWMVREAGCSQANLSGWVFVPHWWNNAEGVYIDRTPFTAQHSSTYIVDMNIYDFVFQQQKYNNRNFPVVPRNIIVNRTGKLFEIDTDSANLEANKMTVWGFASDMMSTEDLFNFYLTGVPA
jgi:hypothetical protein